MGSSSYVQTDFRGGIFSPSSQGRMDDPEYKRALAECYNGYPTEAGNWVRRPPFYAIGYTRLGQPARLLSLASATKSHYNMELSDGHIRAFHGAQFVTDATQQRVSSVVGNLLTTEGETDWVSGDCVIFDMDQKYQNDLASLTSRVFSLEKLTTTTFILHEPISDKAVTIALASGWDSTWVVYVSRLTDVSTVYTGDSWRSVKRIQTNDNVLFLHGAFWPYSLTYTETSPATWANVTLEKAKFKDGPYFDPQEGSVATPTGLTGLVTLDFSYADWDATTAYDIGDYASSGSSHWKSLVAENINHAPADGSAYWERTSALDFMTKKGFVSTDVGRHIRLLSEPPLWDAITAWAEGDKVTFEDTYWLCIAAATGGGAKQPGASTTYWVPYAGGAKWTWGKVSSVAGGTAVSAAALTKIGDMTSGAGLAGLFDSVTSKRDDLCSKVKSTSGYGGIHLSAPSAITGGQAWPGQYVQAPPTWFGVLSAPPAQGTNGGTAGANTFAVHQKATVTINLRAKASAPGSASDGTLLGTSGTLAYNQITGPVYVHSNDATTTWNYVWFEILINPIASGTTAYVCAAEMKFYSSGIQGSQIVVQLLGDALLYSETIRTWRLGLFNDTDPLYPTCGCYHQGRIWLGVGKNRFVASKSGLPFDMAPTEKDGTVTDGSAINYVFDSEVKCDILWMHPGDDGIVLGLPGGERLLFSTTQNNVITPLNINVDLKTSYGSADISPVVAPLTSLFVHANGRDVHEYMRDASSGRFIAPPLTEYAKSLSESGIVEIAYQRALTSIIWACTADGGLIGSSYERTYLPFRSESPPKFNGWHRHEHGAPRLFASVSVGPSINGGSVEALSVITVDHETGLYRVEVAGDLMPEENDIYDCNFLDGRFVPTGGGLFRPPSGLVDRRRLAPPVIPADPPAPAAVDLYSCDNVIFPGFYRSEWDGVTTVPRTDGHAYTNPYVFGTPYSSVLYEWNGATGVGGHGTQIGKYFAIGWDAHVSDTAFLDLQGNRIPSVFTGSVAIFVITGITGTPDSSTIVSCRVVERWDTCLGSAGSYGALVPKPTWPLAP